ncbi:hypothetical protein J437_LFUL015124 [Ladona fulva]|uniref:DDE-1 domain-containing protein n=1 Tax=Ladona fulva TaxID=123851 RepID=A0A8K0KFN4_LADFU|nr:hypothetical protein J437_LFUL015124 [Ladona fulva]
MQDRLVPLMLTESRRTLQVKILPVGQEFASPSGQEFACKLLPRNLLSIPPHSSHKIQPLDEVFFKPLKDYLSQMSDNWLLNHPGRIITNYQIAEIVSQAYERTATIGKGIKGFELCEIFPVNRNVFSDDDFLPSSVTDQPMPVDLRESTSQCDIPPTATNIIASTSDDIVGLTEQMSTEQNVADVTDQAESSFSRPNGRELIDAVITPVRERTVKKWTSPADMIPLPKRQEAQKRKSNKQKSEMLTSSPFKDKLIAAEEKKSMQKRND